MKLKDISEDLLIVQNCLFRLENDFEAIETYANSLPEHDSKYFTNSIADGRETIKTIAELVKKYGG